jgi:hypothetical protein
MTRRFFTVIISFITLLSVVAPTFADGRKPKSKNLKKDSQSQIQLAALLPASDAVISIDMARLLKDALPQVLANKPQTFAKMNAAMEELKTNAGIDLRLFEQVVAGVAIKQVSSKETDFEPIVLARGKFSSSVLIALAKVAAKGKYREEAVGERKIFVFSPKEILAENKPQAGNTTIDKGLDKLMKSLSGEMAIASFDANTVAFGKTERVKETLEGKTHAAPEVLGLMSGNAVSMVSFGANTPSGMSQFIDLDNDEFGKILKSIKAMSGSMDVAEGFASISLNAKTSQNQQATDLEDTLLGLKEVGKVLLGGSKGADKQVYNRVLESAKITRKLSEVRVGIQVSQGDIDILMNKLL